MLLHTKAKHPTDALMGVDTDGQPFVVPIADGPHWLACGQTGSGKSVFVNNICVSMMSHSLPAELQMVWIDPKKVEATAYEDNPYCMTNPVTDMSDAYGLLAYVTWLMDDRYTVLESLKLKKIDEYNDWVAADPERAKAKGFAPWPFIIVIIDEFADLIMVQPDVEQLVARLGQKARAAGIHLIIATQRPSADVVTGLIKANVPSRIGLKTSDSVNSNIVIDESGCENLRGYGDALIRTVDGALTRVQGPFITNDQIEAIFKFQRNTYGLSPNFDYKSAAVEKGLCEWAEEYPPDTPLKDRHVKKVRRSRGGNW